MKIVCVLLLSLAFCQMGNAKEVEIPVFLMPGMVYEIALGETYRSYRVIQKQDANWYYVEALNWSQNGDPEGKFQWINIALATSIFKTASKP